MHTRKIFSVPFYGSASSLVALLGTTKPAVGIPPPSWRCLEANIRWVQVKEEILMEYLNSLLRQNASGSPEQEVSLLFPL